MSHQKINIVAEACCNHQGDFDLALEMIKMAKLCNADYVKFQKRNCIKAVPGHMHNSPHPCPMHSFGETYLQHRQALEFSIEQHKELKDYCESMDIKYACSVWDDDSAAEIISLDTDYIKIPSACNNNYKLLDYIFNNYSKKLHISFGMATIEERKKLISYLSDKKNRVVAYWTTSGYPVRFEELYLLEIGNLKKYFNEVGYSGHNLGIAVDMATIVLGGTWIERHFTLDRTAKGTDNAASLEPTGLSKLVRDAKAVVKSLQCKDIDLTNDEKNNKNKLKKFKHIMRLKMIGREIYGDLYSITVLHQRKNQQFVKAERFIQMDDGSIWKGHIGLYQNYWTPCDNNWEWTSDGSSTVNKKLLEKDDKIY